MDQRMFPIQLRTRYTIGLIEGIQDFFRREESIDYPREVVEKALETWLERRADELVESLPELLTSPSRTQAQEFRLELESAASVPSETSTQQAPEESLEKGTVFTGSRAFSKEKLAAMVAYIANSGKEIYKTNLNKLLFYGDLTFYYLYGRGMSGATYLNLPYGPVPDKIDTMLDELTQKGVVARVDAPEFGRGAQRILPKEGAADSLTDEEKQVLDWVLSTYGSMSSSELSEYSHDEKAYKFTRSLEPIAYEYAKFFRKLPGKDT